MRTPRQPRRVFTAPDPGLTVKHGAFWRGDRIESIMAERKAAYDAELIARQQRRRSKSSGTRRERSPHAELRRLERNLSRRKTLAAKQRIKQQIRLLKRELGL